MSSASEYEPLLSNTGTTDDSLSKAEDLSKLQPCANFLLESEPNKWYKGEIRKNNDTSKQKTTWGKMGSKFKHLLKTTGISEEFSKFISYKFDHTINGTPRTFCITFRKQPNTSKYYNNLGGIDTVFHIRLSLIEKNEDIENFERETGEVLVDNSVVKLGAETPIKCMGSESLIIEAEILGKYRENGIKIPTQQNAEFSSITSGQTLDQVAVVRNMRVMPETIPPNQYKYFFDAHIIKHMGSLGSILVNHCKNPNGSPVSSGGGATRRHTRLTRRRKGVFKRKGKKSYKKKKYGKTKKSRRFRRSGRSRR